MRIADAITAHTSNLILTTAAITDHLSNIKHDIKQEIVCNEKHKYS